jgi:hypothetical protein
MNNTPLYVRNVQGVLSLERYKKEEYETIWYQYKAKAEQVSDDIQRLFCKMDIDSSVERSYDNKLALWILKQDLFEILQEYGIH